MLLQVQMVSTVTSRTETQWESVIEKLKKGNSRRVRVRVRVQT